MVHLLAVLESEERSLANGPDASLFQGPLPNRFTALHEQYRVPVLRYVGRRLTPYDAAEDVVAQTFEAAFMGMSRLKRQADPYVWLLGIARRKLTDAYRKRARQGESPFSDDAPDQRPGPEESFLQCESRQLVRRAVYALAEDQREALLLQYLEKLSHIEIGQVMGRSPAAVNSLVQRARANLERKLLPYFPELEEDHA